MDWELDDEARSMLAFTQSVVTLRQQHPVFRRRRFFAGSADHGGESELGDIAWFTPTGEHMGEEHWRNGYARSLMVFLNGEAIPEPDPRGQRDRRRLLPHPVQRPRRADVVHAAPAEYGPSWLVVFDTAEQPLPRRRVPVRRRGALLVAQHESC